jgi:hypothetical protein
MSATTPTVPSPQTTSQLNDEVINQVAQLAQPVQNGHFDELRDEQGEDDWGAV